MDYLFYQVAAINGFDPFGHYLRAGLILNTCSQYAIASSPDCLANFARQRRAAARAPRRAPTSVRGYADTPPLGLAAPARRRTAAAGRCSCPDARAQPQAQRAGAAPRDGRRRRAAARRRGADRAAPRGAGAAGRDARAARRAGRRRRRRCSTTCWGRRLMRRGSASIAANPVLIGAATTLVVIVAVFLAYNANTACRSSRPTSSRPRSRTRPTSSRATRCASAARASASVDRRSRPVTAKDGSVTARAHAQARDHRQAAAGRLDRPHPPALGARPEVRRDHEGHVEPRASRTARRSRCATRRPQPVEIDEVLSMFDEQTRAASQSNLTEFGNALRRPRPATSTRRSRSSTRC